MIVKGGEREGPPPTARSDDDEFMMTTQAYGLTVRSRKIHVTHGTLNNVVVTCKNVS